MNHDHVELVMFACPWALYMFQINKHVFTQIIVPSWEIWKHRNDCVFENLRPSLQVVLRAVSMEGGLWCSAGASKLQELMPSLLAIGT